MAYLASVSLRKDCEEAKKSGKFDKVICCGSDLCNGDGKGNGAKKDIQLGPTNDSAPAPPAPTDPPAPKVESGALGIQDSIRYVHAAVLVALGAALTIM